MSFRRHKPDAEEIAGILAETAAARQSTSEAHSTRQSIQEQRSWVDSTVSYIKKRRERNGFGEDYTISQTPHFWRNHS
jgi:hypothetical protein